MHRFITGLDVDVHREPVLITALAVAMPSAELRKKAQPIVERFGGRMQPRGTTATFTGPGRAVRCAAALIDELGATGDVIAIGLHVGECLESVGGYRGVAVEVAEGLARGARAGEVLATRTVRDLVPGRTFELEVDGALPRSEGAAAELFSLATQE